MNKTSLKKLKLHLNCLKYDCGKTGSNQKTKKSSKL